jgi:hypothetical protein
MPARNIGCAFAKECSDIEFCSRRQDRKDQAVIFLAGKFDQAQVLFVDVAENFRCLQREQAPVIAKGPCVIGAGETRRVAAGFARDFGTAMAA